jgi:predicted ABC-type ATPase
MLLQEARQAGFHLAVVYVALSRVELHLERVRLRASQGGHSVPPEDIRRRYGRSLNNAPKALKIADSGIVFDNSGLEPAEMLRLKNGAIIWQYQAVPAWVARIQHAVGSLE